jgi:hypothetical protein
LIAIFADLPEVAALGLGQWSHRPVVDDQDINAAKPRQQTAQTTICSRHRKIAEQRLGASVERRVTIAACLLRKSARHKACLRPLVQRRKCSRATRPRWIAASGNGSRSCRDRGRYDSRSPPHKRHVLDKASKFPVLFFVLFSPAALSVIVINQFLYDIRPGNSQLECTNGCKNSGRPNRCQHFCDCIYNQGNPLNTCQFLPGRIPESKRDRCGPLGKTFGEFPNARGTEAKTMLEDSEDGLAFVRFQSGFLVPSVASARVRMGIADRLFISDCAAPRVLSPRSVQSADAHSL